MVQEYDRGHEQVDGGQSKRAATMTHPWVELDLGVLEANIRCLRQALDPGTQIVFLVKSDAYGHGMEPVALRAWQCGVRWLAVARLEEGILLRRLLPQARILLTNGLDPDETVAALQSDLTPFVVGRAHAEALAARAAAYGRVLRGHAKIDTGMGRLGFAWENAAEELAAVAQRPGLRLEGLCTHFASSAGPCAEFLDLQTDRFRQVVANCAAVNLSFDFKHVSNSGAVLRGAGCDLDGVRVGILLYGYGDGSGRRSADSAIPTRPFLQWKARVVHVKSVPAGFSVSYDRTYITRQPTHLATLDVGYGDGYSRALSNRGFVLIGGRRRPVRGRVTMNSMVVEIGPGLDVREGDEAVLLGAQSDESVWADEMAEWSGTIAYEVLTRIRTDHRVCKG